MEISTINRMLAFAGLGNVRRISQPHGVEPRPGEAVGRVQRRTTGEADGIEVHLSSDAIARSRVDEAGATTAQTAAHSPLDAEQQSLDERVELQQLKSRDREVRAHEAAHQAAAGGLAKGGPSFGTTRGPDGRNYAVSGEVQIDTSPVANDPEATIQKMQQVRRAALAPAEPSPQDRRVAADAASAEREARVEQRGEQDESANFSPGHERIERAFGVSEPDSRGRTLDLVA